MTDDEPEPFHMPTDPDGEEADGADDERTADDEAGAGPATGSGGESIADLIDEASRTAAEQAAAEQSGQVPEDRSADVWGDPEETPAPDRDTVWQQAEDDDASNVWDVEGDGDDMWGSAGAPIHDQAPADETVTPPDTAAGPPAAAEGMHDTDDGLEPETFTFPVGDGGTTPAAAAPAGADGQDEEPETFSFPAGPETTAAAPLPDRAATDADEPETFSFPVTGDEPGPAASPERTGSTSAPTDEVEPWPDPDADAADGDLDEDDDVWTTSVATDQDIPLAESASPRDEAGWHDLEAEQEPGWAVSDLAPQAHAGDEEEADGFTAAVEALRDDEDDDDGPWTAPALDDDEDLPSVDRGRPSAEVAVPSGDVAVPSADVVTAEVHDALGDLLGNGEQDAVVETGGVPATPAPATPAAADVAGDAGLDDFDDLDDYDDLEHLDDMAAAAAPTGSHEEADDDAATDEDEDEYERPLDAPTAARKVMEPGSVTFSSGGKKKRGLFG